MGTCASSVCTSSGTFAAIAVSSMHCCDSLDRSCHCKLLPKGACCVHSGDLRAGAGSAFGDAIPEEEEVQHEDALKLNPPAGPAADGDTSGQLQSEPSLAMGSAELRRPARLNASERWAFLQSAVPTFTVSLT